MDVYEQWSQVVKDAVKRSAKSQPRDVRDDFEQECFIELIGWTSQIDTILAEQGEDSAQKYVYSICRNCVFRLSKARGRYESVMLPDGLYPAPDQVEPKKFMGLEESDIDEAIKTLPRDQQHVVRSIFFQDKTESQVAVELGVSQPRINDLKHKAFESLKKLLKES